MLLAGFPNFMAQEAFAVNSVTTYTAATATTTTITISWATNVDIKTGETVDDVDWDVSTGQTVTSITHTNGTATSTLNLGTSLATDATPTITYSENGSTDSIFETVTTANTPIVTGVLSTDGILGF